MRKKGGRKHDLKRIAESFRSGILGRKRSTDMCFAVCAPLHTLLISMYDIQTNIVEGQVDGRNHFWLELQDGRILDPTADQFDGPKVYLGEKPDNYKEMAR